MEYIKLYDKVKIKKTGELAYIVDDNPEELDISKKSYSVEIIDTNEVLFASEEEFEKVEE